ncbi:ABC transporter substrate-binding protein [Tepidiforma flava]|uniref:ABC transporter substrate-binding protein n=1 Tax=Tepidiforma flava TaxID=3004094 RepID=UPI003570D73E
MPTERDQLKAARPDAKFEETQGIGGYIYLRTDKPPFNDKRVRQAISMALNRKAIRDAISKGEGVPEQLYHVGYPWARQVKDLPQAKYWEYNLAEAKKLLAAAIGEGKTIDTTWEHADAAIYTQAYVDTATLAQAQLKQLGINITDVTKPYAQYISTTYQQRGQYVGDGPQPAGGGVLAGLRDGTVHDEAAARPDQPLVRERPEAGRADGQAARAVRLGGAAADGAADRGARRGGAVRDLLLDGHAGRTSGMRTSRTTARRRGSRTRT